VVHGHSCFVGYCLLFLLFVVCCLLFVVCCLLLLYRCPVIFGALSPDGAQASNADPLTRLKIENSRLKQQNSRLKQENMELKKMLGSKGKIPAAKALDKKVNGGKN
jgi:hypothetical protein